jgi:hypothetical protein
MALKQKLFISALLSAVSIACAASAEGVLYQREAATRLPSTDTDWDYMKLAPDGGRLFIARRKDGLTVFDTRTRTSTTLPRSVGANGPLLLPEFDRGYVAMTDGSLLIFQLSDLKVLERRPLADDGGLNGIVYDPATRRIHAVTGARPERSTWHTLDAATGAPIGRTIFPFRKMDDPAVDGRGHIYAPARYDGLILELDSTTLKETRRWKAPDCEQVVVVEHHARSDRLLVACRGAKPVFFAFDPKTGAASPRVPIGAGVDGMAVDDVRGRVVTSGADGTLSVIQRRGADDYRLLGNVSTPALSKIMQMDATSGRLFLVTADHTIPAPGENSTGTVFHPDSFTVLEYAPR